VKDEGTSISSSGSGDQKRVLVLMNATPRHDYRGQVLYCTPTVHPLYSYTVHSLYTPCTPTVLIQCPLPVHDYRGQITGVVGIGQDITVLRKVTQEKERLLRNMAEHATQVQYSPYCTHTVLIL
jgi:hypothetical protein